MTQDGQAADANLRAVFESVLNRHGHPFQYAVIRRAHELRDERRSPWVFEASEFPVEVRGHPTRIDFVLSQWAEDPARPFRFLVAECKRADPSLANWVFAKAPYVRRGGTTRDVLVETVRRDGRDLAAALGRLDGSDNIYHVAYDVKGAAKGDGGGTGRGAIEEAATQVMRGVNGLIECLSNNRRYVPEEFPIAFVPVIFTTATLWASDVDLAMTDLTGGRVPPESANAVVKPWLWLQYHTSPGLRHGVDRQVSKDDPMARTDLGHLMELEYARMIAVVGQGAVDAFLASERWMF